MMPPPIEQDADAQLNTIWVQLQADQTVYFAAHGVYWQGLLTHPDAIPHDGIALPPTVGTETPTDQPVPWPPVYLANPLVIACDVAQYAGPAGPGYVLTARLGITSPGGGASVQWQKALALGPEGGAYDWVRMPLRVGPPA